MHSSYKALTVSEFQRIAAINENEPAEVKACLKLEILTSKSYEYFDELQWSSLDIWLGRLKMLELTAFPTKLRKMIVINGHVYRLRPECKDYSKGIYLSLKAYDGNYIQNMHKVLSVLYRPLYAIDKDKQHADFKVASLGQVYGAFFLFSRKLQNAKLRIAFLNLESQTVINQRLKEIETELPKHMAGSIY